MNLRIIVNHNKKGINFFHSNRIMAIKENMYIKYLF